MIKVENVEVIIMDEIKSPLKAIKQFCFECCGENRAEVKRCTSIACPLKAFRFGKNPYLKRDFTEEQKREARERLKKARENND